MKENAGEYMVSASQTHMLALVRSMAGSTLTS